jgi:hypothetical protein
MYFLPFGKLTTPRALLMVVTRGTLGPRPPHGRRFPPRLVEARASRLVGRRARLRASTVPADPFADARISSRRAPRNGLK